MQQLYVNASFILSEDINKSESFKEKEKKSHYIMKSA